MHNGFNVFVGYFFQSVIVYDVLNSETLNISDICFVWSVHLFTYSLILNYEKSLLAKSVLAHAV